MNQGEMQGLALQELRPLGLNFANTFGYMVGISAPERRQIVFISMEMYGHRVWSTIT